MQKFSNFKCDLYNNCKTVKSLFEVENLAFNQYVSIYVLAFIPTLIIQLKKVIFEFIENKKSKNNANINRSDELKDIA